MKLDLSCPAEVRGYALSYETGKVEAHLRLYNLSSHRIACIEGIAKWRVHDTAQSIVSPFVANGLRAGSCQTFSIVLSTTLQPNANRLELLFTRIRFDDEPDWIAGNGPYAELAPLPAMHPDTLRSLKAAAGTDAVCFPSRKAETWQCVCGRLNPDCIERCGRCHRNYSEIFRFTPENLAQYASPPAHEAPVDAEIIAAIKRKQRFRFARALLLVTAALLLTVLIVTHNAPKSPVVTTALSCR